MLERIAIAVTMIVVTSASCGAPPAIVHPPRPAVEIVSNEPCAVPDADAFYAAMKDHDAHHAHDHGDHAKVAPISVEDAYPRAQLDQLKISASEGRCRRIRYRSDGVSVVGFIIEPPGVPARSPAILIARGGNRELGKIGTGMLVELDQLARTGFVILATQYRGVDGGDGVDEFGGADLADLENLVPLARTMKNVDADNLFLLGYSRGGMEAAMALRDKLPVRAAALFSGLYDLEGIVAGRPEMEANYREMIPGFATNRAREMSRRSAVDWAGELHTPILLLAGTQDSRVPIAANSERLATLLDQHDLEHKLVKYDDDHQLAGHRDQTTHEIVSWFLAHKR